MLRTCIRCGDEIDKCMGFVLARDILKGLVEGEVPREYCGKCALVVELEELEGLDD